jgi:hypothetical protein
MKIKFFLGINQLLSEAPSFGETKQTYKQRTLARLKKQKDVLSKFVEHAATYADENLLPVVACGEDFFQSSLIYTDSEYKKNQAKCMDRDVVYRFIANTLTTISRRFPDVLIIPGSIYAGVDVTDDPNRYAQNGRVRKARFYTQNIAPVLFNGRVIRLIKKGGFLFNKTTQEEIITSTDHARCYSKRHNMLVPRYNEDLLEDLNDGLIHLGKTALPGEESLLAFLGFSEDLSNPHFDVSGIKFCLEICGDHGYRDHETSHVDVHFIVSDGIANCYDATHGHGYYVQVDAESLFLTKIACSFLPRELTMLDVVTYQGMTFFTSQVLCIIREEWTLIQLERLLKNTCTSSPKNKKHGMFYNVIPRPVVQIAELLIQMRSEDITFEEGMRQIAELNMTIKDSNTLKAKIASVCEEYKDASQMTRLQY